MAIYKIKEYAPLKFRFYIDDVMVLDNMRNLLTVDWLRDPLGELHFKTSFGAYIFLKQEILATDLIIENQAGDEFTSTDVDDVQGYLEDIHFNDWQYSGGSPTPTGNRFDALLDTFTYTGKSGKIPMVNDSETGLIAVDPPYDSIVKMRDYAPQDVPFAATDLGKKFVIAQFGSEFKATVANDTNNTPTSPNQIIIFDYTTDVEEFTVLATSAVRVDGIIYSDPTGDVSLSVANADTGKERFDIIYGKADPSDGFPIWEIIQGAEVTLGTNAVIPYGDLPANTVVAAILRVTESGFTTDTMPLGAPWVTKASQGNNVVTGAVDNLPLNNLTTYQLMSAGTYKGVSVTDDSPPDDPFYSGDRFLIQNNSGSPITLSHMDEDAARFPFFFYNLADFTLAVGQCIAMYFDKVNGRFNFVGVIATGGGGGYAYTTFEQQFTWNTGDPFSFTLLDNRIAVNVFIDRTLISIVSAEWDQSGADIELNDVNVVGKFLFDGSVITVTGIQQNTL